MEEEAKKLLKLKDLNNYATELRGRIKQDAKELKDKRKLLQEVQHQMDELSDLNLDLRCEPA